MYFAGWSNSSRAPYFKRSASNAVKGNSFTPGRYKIVVNGAICQVYNSSNELIQQLTQENGYADEGVSPMAVFGRNNTSTAGSFSIDTGTLTSSAKLYEFKMTSGDGTVLCDLVPALMGETLCMIDLANAYHPHFNCGSGDFEYGSVTNDNPITYQP